MAAHTSWPHQLATPAGHTSWPPPAKLATCDGCTVCHSVRIGCVDMDVQDCDCGGREGGTHQCRHPQDRSEGQRTSPLHSTPRECRPPSDRASDWCRPSVSKPCSAQLGRRACTPAIASSLTHHTHTHNFCSRFQRLQAYTPFRSPHATNERYNSCATSRSAVPLAHPQPQRCATTTNTPPHAPPAFTSKLALENSSM
jgi:hypothetical protein